MCPLSPEKAAGTSPDPVHVLVRNRETSRTGTGDPGEAQSSSERGGEWRDRRVRARGLGV